MFPSLKNSLGFVYKDQNINDKTLKIATEVYIVI